MDDPIDAAIQHGAMRRELQRKYGWQMRWDTWHACFFAGARSADTIGVPLAIANANDRSAP